MRKRIEKYIRDGERGGLDAKQRASTKLPEKTQTEICF